MNDTIGFDSNELCTIAKLLDAMAECSRLGMEIRWRPGQSLEIEGESGGPGNGPFLVLTYSVEFGGWLVAPMNDTQ
jgi:hypothetical protein